MKINLQDIRKLVPGYLYDRGRSYYHQGRVQLVEIEPHYFKATVLGTHEYLVEVKMGKDGWFYGECSCPYWSNCKHIVAGLLAAKDYYDNSAHEPTASSDWKRYLAQINSQQSSPPAKPKWQLLYTLEPGSSGWSLHPQKSPIKKDGSQGMTRNLNYGDFFENSIARSASDNLALSFLEKWEHHGLYGYSYQPWNGFTFKYGDKVGKLLSLLRESRVYFYDRVHFQLGAPVNFAGTKARIEFRLTDTGERAKLVPYLRFEENEWALDSNFLVLCSEPIWLLKHDVLIEVEGMNNAAALMPFTRKKYEVSIPKEDVPTFLNALAAQTDLFQNFRLPGETQVQTVQEITAKRLYLDEFEEGLLVNLRFCYGGVEVDRNDVRMTLWGSDGRANGFVKVLRNGVEEAAALDVLLRTGLKLTKDGRITTRKGLSLDWLLDEVPKLVAAGFTLFGEEKLQRFKVNRAVAQIRVAVESGIDWFDLNVEIDFGGMLLSLKELQKAMKLKSRYVKLADGSLAQLPEYWLQRFQHVLNFAEAEEGRLKFSHFHVTLIDELFAQASQKTFDQSYQEKVRQLQNFVGIKNVPVPASLQGTLRPYQSAGFDWLQFLKEFRFGGCLADDMGLGKTIQALALLLSVQQEEPIAPSLIVTPTSVIFNWMNELNRFAPSLRVYNQTGGERDRSTKNYNEYDVVLTSYGTLRRDILFLKDVQFNYVILDESQFIKNPLSQTAKAAKVLKSKHRLALTGTPVENTTVELWSLFSFLNPGLLGNLNYFKEAFARPIEQNRDAGAVELLRKMVFPFVLRRTKDQVEKELPPKVENIVYCDMSPPQAKLYTQWRDYYRAALLKQIAEVGLHKARMNVLQGLMKLRQIACHPVLVEESYHHKAGKYDALVEYFDELLAEGHKVLLFSQFVKMLTVIRRHLDSAGIPYEYLDGKTRDRKSCVERFQTDDTCKIFLISLRAGGTGLNLTAADYVIHYDPWWNPAVETQATDRSHRIGQDKRVFVYKLITKGTVEEKILQLQERKKELVSNIIATDTGLFKHLTVEDIEGLFS